MKEMITLMLLLSFSLQGQQSAGYTPQQRSLITRWKCENVGAKLENELINEERTYTKQLVSSKSDKVFPHQQRQAFQ